MFGPSLKLVLQFRSWLLLLLLHFALLQMTTGFGAIVRTFENQVYEGQATFSQNGNVSVTLPNGERYTIPLENVSHADFGLVPASGNSLPRGWSLEELGRVHAHCIHSNNAFSLRTTGGIPPRDSKSSQVAAFAYRILRADAEIMARIGSVQGNATDCAGLMLRENLEPQGGFVLLGVTPEGQLEIHSRESGWREARKKQLGEVRLPLWLKLTRREKTVEAWRSSDGKSWEKLEQTLLVYSIETYPEGSTSYKPKTYTGLALTGPCTNSVSSAEIGDVRFVSRGLLGLYYMDDQFQQLRFSRPESKLNYWWGSGTPAPGMTPYHFSVRWVGQLEAKASGPYQFFFDADPPANLWLNDQQLLPTPVGEKEKKKKSEVVPLQAGEKYPLKIEYAAGGCPEAHLHLKWSSPSISGEEIHESQLSWEDSTDAPVESLGAEQPNPFGAPGVWLLNGTFLAGEIRGSDETATRMTFAGTNELVVLNSRIATMILSRNRPPLPLDLIDGRSGVIFKNGDFFECTYTGLKDRSVSVSSVLFGRRKFRLEEQAAALVLNACEPQPGRYEVRLMDGSLLQASGLRAAADFLLVKDAVLGEVKVPVTELREIKRARAL